MRVDENLRALQRAQGQVANSAHRIATMDVEGLPPAGEDGFRFGGTARVRLFGERPPRVSSIADEAIRLKQAEHAFRFNLRAIEVASSLDKESTSLIGRDRGEG